ncbi:UNVERIFIED_CONTAM: hypothetical protein Sindi_0202200, partial [Sesamum indicum]
QLIEPLLGQPCEGDYEHTAFDPRGVMVEKGNIFKVGEVLLRICGSAGFGRLGSYQLRGSSSAMISSLKGITCCFSKGVPFGIGHLGSLFTGVPDVGSTKEGYPAGFARGVPSFLRPVVQEYPLTCLLRGIHVECGYLCHHLLPL